MASPWERRRLAGFGRRFFCYFRYRRGGAMCRPMRRPTSLKSEALSFGNPVPHRIQSSHKLEKRNVQTFPRHLPAAPRCEGGNG